MPHLSNRLKITLSKEALGTGGEGTVFAVESPAQYRQYVAKIYHPTERKPEKEAKIKHLIENPLSLKDKFSFIFPQELLYERGEFIGYLMLRARGEYDLTVLSSLNLSAKLEESWIEKYRRDKPENLRNYQKIAYHLALAFAEFYQQENYIFTDLKPENIKVNLQGLISVIDLDSLQIQQNGKVLFPAEKISQEYSPPEREIFKEGEILSPSWTYFSMSVILYKLLLGLHPFSVTGKGDLRRLATLADKIKYGLFPFGQQAEMIEVIPAPHQNFKSFPQAWQEVFIKSLATFLTQPDYRPNAQVWAEALQIKTLALKEYKNPLVKSQPKLPTQPDGFLLEKPVRHWNLMNLSLGLSFASILPLLNEIGIDWLKGAALGFFIPLSLLGALNLFQKLNLKIDTREQLLIIKTRNLFYTQTKNYPLRQLRFVLQEIWTGNARINFDIYYKNKWGIQYRIVNIWVGKKGENKDKVRLIIQTLLKLNLSIESEGADLNKFLYDV